MERFKKRTIALLLASVVTVVGAFGAENYKNTLMGIKFENSGNELVNMVLQTKAPCSLSITPVRKDANTYVLTLPEINSSVNQARLSEASGIVKSMDIRTMPYSNTTKGYTRITVKISNPSVNIRTQNQVYVASSNEEKQIASSAQSAEAKERARQLALQRQKIIAEKNAKTQKALEARKAKLATLQAEQKKQKEQNAKNISTSSASLKEVPARVKQTPTQKSSGNNYAWLYAVLIVLVSCFYFVRAKNRMQEIAGESLDIDIRNEKSNKKLKKIKNTINHLDSKYSNTAVHTKNEYTQPITPVKKMKPAEELNVVDLDELFQEHKSKKQESLTKEQEENAALEDFLSGFSFDESFGEEEIIEEALYDEESFNEIVQNENLSFTTDDLNCIAQLLNTEIQDETIRNINKYAISNPIKKAVPKQQILENLISTYSISQKITFTQDDVSIIKKLINVELDADFITDLRTNPERTKEMEKEILSYGDKPKKPSKIITLNVKDMLPDLSEALRQHGDKQIESNHKPETIYFSEGYEVKTLSVDNSLPDLTIEINNEKAYISKPSAKYDIVDNTYTIGTGELKTADELPDLSDVLANPEKYAEPEPEEIIIDEKALLNNIANVQFKPFYDGTTEFEILNHFEEEENIVDEKPQVITEQSKTETEVQEPVVQENEPKAQAKTIKKDFEPVKLERKPEIQKRERSSNSQKIMQQIEATRRERQERKEAIHNKQQQNISANANNKPAETETLKCLIDNEILTVISSTNFIGNLGCHLAKGENGYTILGFVGEKLFKIKHYEILKSEKIQSRKSDVLSDGTMRFIVRIGLHKFIVEVKDENIEYVMDLC